MEHNNNTNGEIDPNSVQVEEYGQQEEQLSSDSEEDDEEDDDEEEDEKEDENNVEEEDLEEDLEEDEDQVGIQADNNTNGTGQKLLSGDTDSHEEENIEQQSAPSFPHNSEQAVQWFTTQATQISNQLVEFSGDDNSLNTTSVNFVLLMIYMDKHNKTAKFSARMKKCFPRRKIVLTKQIKASITIKFVNKYIKSFPNKTQLEEIMQIMNTTIDGDNDAETIIPDAQVTNLTIGRPNEMAPLILHIKKVYCEGWNNKNQEGGNSNSDIAGTTNDYDKKANENMLRKIKKLEDALAASELARKQQHQELTNQIQQQQAQKNPQGQQGQSIQQPTANINGIATTRFLKNPTTQQPNTSQAAHSGEKPPVITKDNAMSYATVLGASATINAMNTQQTQQNVSNITGNSPPAPMEEYIDIANEACGNPSANQAMVQNAANMNLGNLQQHLENPPKRRKINNKKATNEATPVTTTQMPQNPNPPQQNLQQNNSNGGNTNNGDYAYPTFPNVTYNEIPVQSQQQAAGGEPPNNREDALMKLIEMNTRNQQQMNLTLQQMNSLNKQYELPTNTPTSVLQTLFGGKYANKYFNLKGQVIVPLVVQDVDELAKNARKKAMIHETHIFQSFDPTWMALFEVTGILDWSFGEEGSDITKEADTKFDFDMTQVKSNFGQQVRNFLKLRKSVNTAQIGIENFSRNTFTDQKINKCIKLFQKIRNGHIVHFNQIANAEIDAFQVRDQGNAKAATWLSKCITLILINEPAKAVISSQNRLDDFQEILNAVMHCMEFGNNKKCFITFCKRVIYKICTKLLPLSSNPTPEQTLCNVSSFEAFKEIIPSVVRLEFDLTQIHTSKKDNNPDYPHKGGKHQGGKDNNNAFGGKDNNNNQGGKYGNPGYGGKYNNDNGKGAGKGKKGPIVPRAYSLTRLAFVTVRNNAPKIFKCIYGDGCNNIQHCLWSHEPNAVPFNDKVELSEQVQEPLKGEIIRKGISSLIEKPV